jgi:hypothetical protein
MTNNKIDLVLGYGCYGCGFLPTKDTQLVSIVAWLVAIQLNTNGISH